MTRVDSIVHHKERIHKLRECGLVQIEMGLEAGNTKGLSVYNKRISIDQSFEAVSFLRKERIDFGMSGFIMYHPFIKIEDLRQNANFLNKIEYWKIMFLLTKMALYPGAAITNKVKNSNLLYDTYSHYEVYDYRFDDPQVELLYTSLAERLPFELLNEISEGIVYIELQLNLIYRKIEKISNNNNNILLQLEYGETEIKDEIRKSKHLIFNFFMSILDLIEYNWNIKEFDTLIAVFSLEYTKANEKIINKYQEYSAYIEKLVEQIS